MPELVYALNTVSKTYGTREILRIDSLEIYRGEVLGVIGPSGAGKSTLLRLLNFLEAPTTGEIWYEDFRANGSGPPPLELQRQVTTVFQRPVLFNGNVLDNVGFGLRLRGVRGTRPRIETALQQVGLLDFMQAPAKSLSGGEMQRVALARAMVIEPRVLLLDEPTANLDPGNVAIIERIVTGLNKTVGTTIVLVTHNVFQAKRLAHRVALMLDGRIIEIGATEATFEAPRDPRTAAFIRGEMVY